MIHELCIIMAVSFKLKMFTQDLKKFHEPLK